MSKKNHTKSELFLMEFIAVILFFSICAAICISAFVKADNISKDSDLLNGAMILAQSVAEEIKATEVITGQKYQNYKDDIYYLDVRTEIKDKIMVADIIVFDVTNKGNEICRLEVKKYLPDEV